MVKSETTSITPATHAARHVVGGADPLINPLLLHAARHAPGGADPVPTYEDGGGTQVLDLGSSGGAPRGWTDIDCSAVCGAKYSLLFLLVRQDEAGGAVQGRFRPKGGADVIYNGVTAVSLNNTNHAYIVCATDQNGFIQYASVAWATFKAWVVGYI